MTATTQPGNKYVYCVIRAAVPLSFGPIGIGERGDAPVYTLHHEDLAAVVSDTPVTVYDPTRANVLAHERVNELVLQDHTMLPLAFGTVFRSEADVIALMQSTAATLRDVLDRLEGKIEYGLKVFWDRDQAVASLEQANDAIRHARARIATMPEQTAYYERIHLGQLIESGLRNRAQAYAGAITDSLRDVAIASQVNDPIGDRMVLNAAFLVERSGETAFAGAIEEIAARYDSELTFKFGGPWPPYNFVRVRLSAGSGAETRQ